MTSAVVPEIREKAQGDVRQTPGTKLREEDRCIQQGNEQTILILAEKMGGDVHDIDKTQQDPRIGNNCIPETLPLNNPHLLLLKYFVHICRYAVQSAFKRVKIQTILNRSTQLLKRRLFPGQKNAAYGSFERLLRKNGYTICINKFIPESYDPNHKNILFLIESPAMVEHYWEQWIRPDMQFVAEISFNNYFKLANYHCCRSLYVANDNFVNLSDCVEPPEKTALVSLIYSDKIFLEGHRFRHEISRAFSDRLELWGEGTGRFLQHKIDSLLPYAFQVVVENGKYPEYVSEKFFDCLKTYTVPIYWGGERALKEMGFDPRGYFSFDTQEELAEILAGLSFDDYQGMFPYLLRNRERLIALRRDAGLSLTLGMVQLHGYFHNTQSYFEGKWDTISMEI